MEAFGGEPPEVLEEVFKPEVRVRWLARWLLLVMMHVCTYSPLPPLHHHHLHHRHLHHRHHDDTLDKVVAYQEKAPTRSRYNGYRRSHLVYLCWNIYFDVFMSNVVEFLSDPGPIIVYTSQ